jgi:hypothetical protein
MLLKLNAVMRSSRTIAIRFALWVCFWRIFLKRLCCKGLLKIEASFQAGSDDFDGDSTSILSFQFL